MFCAVRQQYYTSSIILAACMANMLQNYWWFVQAWLTFFTCYVGWEGWTKYRFFHAKDKGFKVTVPQVALLLIIFSMVVRVWYYAVDPAFTRRILPYFSARMFFSICAPLAWIPTALILVFWSEVSQGTMVKKKRGAMMSWRVRCASGAAHAPARGRRGCLDPGRRSRGSTR